MPNLTNAASRVSEVAPADSADALRYFESLLPFETDCWDVHEALENGKPEFVLLDVRGPQSFQSGHLPGAINLPHRDMNEQTLAAFSKEQLLVVYCWGPGCNGATKAAAKLSALGFRVKEMIGGIEYWRKEGSPVEGTLGSNAPMYG